MGSRERAVEVLQFALCGVEVSGLDPYENLASANELVAALESAGLEIVPANLLDAVIAATRDGMSNQYDFSIGIMGEDDRLKCLYLEMNQAAIAAIRAAWEGATDGD